MDELFKQHDIAYKNKSSVVRTAADMKLLFGLWKLKLSNDVGMGDPEIFEQANSEKYLNDAISGFQLKIVFYDIPKVGKESTTEIAKMSVDKWTDWGKTGYRGANAVGEWYLDSVKDVSQITYDFYSNPFR